jgi:osmotically-inducible protein OsmY
MQINKAQGDLSLRRNAPPGLKLQISVAIANLGALVANTADLLKAYAVRWGKKWGAVCGPRRVAKEKSVANEIMIKPLETAHPTDGEIASAAAHQIDLMTSIPSGTLKITVNRGRVTLDGDVEWDYQQTAAGNAVKYLSGVEEVKNFVGLRPHADALPGLGGSRKGLPHER